MMMMMMTAAPKKFLKKLTSTRALEWPNSARNLSVNYQIKIEIVRKQMHKLTRITPCYCQEEWHEQCECYHYSIRSGKKLKFRDRSLFIARVRERVRSFFFGGGDEGGVHENELYSKIVLKLLATNFTIRPNSNSQKEYYANSKTINRINENCLSVQVLPSSKLFSLMFFNTRGFNLGPCKFLSHFIQSGLEGVL